MLSSKAESVSLLCNRLKFLDVHPALCIFKSSLPAPRFNYLLRAAQTFLLPGALKEVDEMFRTTLSFGGLGIRKVEDLAYPTYLSSLFRSVELSNKRFQEFSLSVLDTDIYGKSWKISFMGFTY